MKPEILNSECRSAGSGASAARTERRRERRRAAQSSVTIVPLKSKLGYIQAQVVNFSDHGLSLLAPLPIPLGERFLVQASLGRPILFVYVVRSCAGVADRFRIGAAYSGTLALPERESDMLRARFVQQLHANAATPPAPKHQLK